MRVTQESLKILEPALSITEKLSKQIIPKKESSKPGTFQKQIPDYVIAQLQVIKGLFSLENETQTLLFTKAFLGKYQLKKESKLWKRCCNYKIIMIQLPKWKRTTKQKNS